VRAVEALRPVIAKINVLKDGDLGLGEADRVRLRRYVAFAIKHILGSTESFAPTKTTSSGARSLT